MAEPVRRRIVDLLASGESTSGQLAEVISHEFRVSRTAVSKHLRVLRDAGFVDVRAELSWRWYRLTSHGLEVLEDAIDDLRMKWDRRVGWDADRMQEFDPLAAPPYYAAVPRRGPGRNTPRGRRGRQTEDLQVTEPDLGLFPGA
ncbi:MAG: metalloregulator ArsR/SmtB family transcription factor [Microbacterium sp.]